MTDENDTTCPVCRDPYGGQHLSVRHTWTDGCPFYGNLLARAEEALANPPAERPICGMCEWEGYPPPGQPCEHVIPPAEETR